MSEVVVMRKKPPFLGGNILTLLAKRMFVML